MWLRTEDGYYISEIRGVVYVTWVSEQDKAHAAVFPNELISEWRFIMERTTGKYLEAIVPFA